MRTILTVLLTVSFLAAAALVAADDPNTPDCNADQRDPTTTSDRVSDRSAPLRGTQGSGACEGEHWDGADPISSGEDTGAHTSGSGATVSVGSNSAYDKPDPFTDATDVVRVRVSATTDGQAFTRTAIFGVGIASVYAGQTDGDATAATYLEDHSDQIGTASCPAAEAIMTGNEVANGDHHTVQDGDCNMLAAAVHFAHITMGQDVGEEDTDCTQADYQAGSCKRDNTAITVELLA